MRTLALALLLAITQEGEEAVEEGASGVQTEWRVHYQCSSGIGLPP